MSLDIDLSQLSTAHHVLLHNLHITVPSGVIHTVMGASGSGKSSLLAAICGTLAEDVRFEGTITLHGRRIDQRPTEHRHIGILFQEDLLFAHMTVFENLLFAVPPGARALRHGAVAQGLEDLEMSSFAQANPATLSGGQRGRIALMRALLALPQALLLDEPFSKLDATLRERVRAFVFAQCRQRQIPVLLVTHDACDVADTAHLTRL